MSSKSKIVIFSIAIGVVVLAIFVNYIFSEVYSTSGNVIRRVYFKNTFVKAEVADTQAKISQGLAGRESLAEDRGMLFVIPKVDFQRFWMKGMRFPIDIIWIERGRVIGFEKNISPKDDRIFTSPSVAGLILEVPAGFCDKFNVQINDQVTVQ